MTDGDAAPNMVTTKDIAGSALAWDAGYAGAGMLVAIIDTGLDIDHPSFADAVPTTDELIKYSYFHGSIVICMSSIRTCSPSNRIQNNQIDWLQYQEFD